MKFIEKFKLRLLTIGIIIFTSLVSGCISQKGIKKTKNVAFAIQVGSNKGGITENTDIVKTNNVDVDAYSGATNKNKIGINAGVHFLFPLKENIIETGLDIMSNNHIFKYSDVKNAYFGERNIDITQLMLPVTYNFNFFKNGKSYGSFQIKVGLNLQYNYLAITNYGILPEYDYKKISGGLTIGFRLLPFNFKNDKILGFYLDAYRGSQIYEDFYNRSNFEMPGSSFSKFGVFFQF